MPPLRRIATTQLTRAVRLAVLGASLASLYGFALMPTEASAQSPVSYTHLTLPTKA